MRRGAREAILDALGVVRYRLRVRRPPTAGAAFPADPAAKDNEVPAPEREAPSQAAHEAAPPRTPSATPRRSLAFRLCCWQPEAGWLVLSSLPPGERPSAEQRRMLGNLLRRLGVLAGELPPAEYFDWPVGPGLDDSLAGAREMLASFLAARRERAAFAHVLLMGPLTALVATSSERPRVGMRFSLPGGAEGIVTHSLYAMERDRTLRRETWAALAHLAPGEGG